ncbi:crotonase/enoyl-CoA hydratase family protein [Cognatilysobacter lacus]|uniref:Crotonase/enoyl-CoA hydratase family protein n=1 Tax=Cognatilysobacter lacus TaxID=1643323 RepID=A0A5D8ZAY9_9GAMM|nr:crotonase/enoyl-CoA hydratase family protein [Lysobacter lacus]TZF91292.1 crotonase/enoyl-CoA hydratase family protein [Lysobacter lacus]
MSTKESLHRARTYPTVRVESDAGGSQWLHMHADHGAGVRPCFRRELMHDMWSMLSEVTPPQTDASVCPLQHVVLASDAPGAFNLGGDLELFASLIRSGDRDGLMDYATRCIDGVHLLHQGLGGNVRTIALVQGDALGGGMELALACQVIVAEEGVEMGLPEVLFGLFPGMGAYSFLSRRVAPQLAERLILEGRILPAHELHRMGIVDILAPRGHGARIVRELIQQEQRAPHAHLALNRVRRLAQAVTYEELLGITSIWVDAALALGDRSLRAMERIVRAQARRSAR